MRKLLAGITLALASVTAQAALVIAVSPVDTTVNVGDMAVIKIVGSGFSNIVRGGFDLTYNPAIVSLGSTANISLATPPWDGTFPRTDVVNDAAGTVSDFSFNQFDTVSGDGIQIATLTFKAIKVGVSDLVLSGSDNFPFADSGAAALVAAAPVGDAPQFHGGVIRVVPEPTAWGLIIAGLGFIVLLAGRRNQRSLKIQL